MATEALADLIGLALDQDTKSVLQKYNTNLESSVIFRNLRKCSVESLKKAANFLNMGDPFDYKNKEDTTYWVIQKIENFLPENCKMCNNDYTVSYGNSPSLKCLLCGQGIHEECFHEKLQDGAPLPDIPGLHWMCPSCESNASTAEQVALPEKSSSSQTQAQTEENGLTGLPLQPQVPEPITDTADTGTENQVDTHSEVIQPIQDVKDPPPKPICRYYKQSTCKYGVSGRGCTFSHPKACKRFMSFGNRSHWGCSRGDGCKFYHPKVCPSSKNSNECFKENCRLTHLKGTKRHPGPTSNSPPPLFGISTTPGPPAQQPVPLINPSTRTWANIVSDCSRAHPSGSLQTPSDANEMQPFLGLLQKIQQQLATMEQAQYSQGQTIQKMLTMVPPPVNHTIQPTQFRNHLAIPPPQFLSNQI